MTDDERKEIQNRLQRVVCAANRKGDVVLIGARHWDGWMAQQADRAGIRGGNGEEQGFIDQFGNFLTRKEAWQIAKHQNQIIRYCADQTEDSVDETLWSENLY